MLDDVIAKNILNEVVRRDERGVSLLEIIRGSRPV